MARHRGISQQWLVSVCGIGPSVRVWSPRAGLLDGGDENIIRPFVAKEIFSCLVFGLASCSRLADIRACGVRTSAGRWRCAAFIRGRAPRRVVRRTLSGQIAWAASPMQSNPGRYRLSIACLYRQEVGHRSGREPNLMSDLRFSFVRARSAARFLDAHAPPQF